MGIGTILVANRGEIALRVMRTARRLGCRTVAIYSSADAGAPHVEAADEAVLVGPAPAGDSYLCIERILDAGRRTRADAVHPGYGFLSENAGFARACAEAGLVFIGPPPEAIELMGNKAAAKRRMLAAGVPCIPGYEGEDQSDQAFEAAASRIGFPVLVKAAAGGGGRGMRLCTDPADLLDALRSARAEAKSAFGSDELILEEALSGARHIEVQVLGDVHGQLVHLGERDCSVQRRHQKVIEESPSPVVDTDLRARMGKTAIEVARAAGYVNAGTVELLYDASGAFYFLEMNTRLQVEHPVTELTTGLDLVEWQIRVANQEPLPFTQVALAGHAIEARLYAEDPDHGFLPQTGKVLRWGPPPEVRVDHGVREGMTVSPHYDPMIAKVIAHGANRDEARHKLVQALRGLTLHGVRTNKAYLLRILDDEVFAAGRATTAFTAAPGGQPDPSLAALVLYLEGARGLCEDDSFIGWRSGGPLWSTVKLACHGHETELRVTREGSHYTVRRDEHAVIFEVARHEPGELAFIRDGIRRVVRYAIDGERVWLDDEVFDDVTHRPAQVAGGAGSGILRAPLDGAVTRLFVSPGDAVARGQLVLVLEAMKMEHRIVADVDGTVASLHVDTGVQVKTRQLLAEIHPQDPS